MSNLTLSRDCGSKNINEKYKKKAIDVSKIPPFIKQTVSQPLTSGVQPVSFPFNGQDKFYFNIEVQGNLTDPYKLAEYNMQFNQAILRNPENYYCAVSKFSLPSIIIPIFLPDLSPSYNGVSNFDTIYTVTLTYMGTAYKQIVQYNPQNGYPFPSEFYGYIYDFTWFCAMVNGALAAATTATGLGGLIAPYLQYDSQTNLISLVCTTANYDQQAMNPVGIYVNYPLSVLLSGINQITAPNGIIPDPNGEDAQFLISNQGNNFYNPPEFDTSVPPAYYIFTQQYPALEAFSPIASIRLLSNTLPIARESILNGNTNSVLGSAGIVQTFYPVANSTFDTRPFNITYIADGNYHLINMNGSDIDKLQLSFEWIDLQGNAHPCYISYNSVMLVELVFLKKSTFTS